jgi:DNA polymerase III epsilon subunit-like protein
MKYPNTYIVWDLETTGLKPEDAHIIEIGLIQVQDGEVVDRKNWVLNHGIEIPEEITKITGITKEIIDAEGKDPQECFSGLMDVLRPGVPHLTHNGIRFDIPFLAHHLAKAFNKTVGEHKELLDWLNKSAIDTAVFVKANKLNMEWKWGESFKEFADRVMSVFAKGVKYNVGICCEELEVDTEGMTQHRALGDTELTHRIYQKLK